MKRHIYAILILLAGTYIAFQPSLDNGYVNWDDDRNFYENKQVTEITKANFWENMGLIFQSSVIGNYNPLPIATFAIEKLVFGLDKPYYWHLDNLILHLICVVLAFRIALMLGLSLQGAFFVAMLFGIHPLRVESVAWLTERKDVLFGVFYLGAIFLYIKYLQTDQNRKYHWWIFLLFVLSLFSKIQAVTLPVTFILIDYYLKGKLNWKIALSKWPYFVISATFGIIGIFVLKGQGSLEANNTYEWFQRPFVGSFSFMVYLVKSIVPYRMVPLYPYLKVMSWYMYVSMFILPVTVWFIWFTWKRDYRKVLFGFMFFVINIFFLLQILGAGQGYLADRFTYIPYFGLFFIYAYLLERLVEWKPMARPIVSGIAVLYLLGLGYITYEQTKIWKDGASMWTHVIKYYSNITTPFGNRGNWYRDHGQRDSALKDYSASIRLNPKNAGPYNSRAKLYFMSNNVDTARLALADYNKAISLKTTNSEFYANRGAAYAKLQMLDSALIDLNKSIEMNPKYATAYLNRFIVLRALNRLEEAYKDTETFLTLTPDHAGMKTERENTRKLIEQKKKK